MNFTRRNFIRKAGLLGILPVVGLRSVQASPGASGLSFEDFSDESDFWEWIRDSYTVSSNITNLNNGGVSPQPKVVQDVFEQYNRMSNEGPSYYMWRILDKGRTAVRQTLAELAGCDPGEIAIQRNATEALDAVIMGMKLNPGDEVIVTNYDYPNMRNAWLHREKRDGIRLVWVSVPIGVSDEEQLTGLFANAITARTKVIHITHIINWTGQILPAKKITAKAHEHGIEVILDAAHSFAHIDFSLHDIGCDYAGTSLHKWLCAPFGTGMLYVKKDRITTLQPMFPGEDPYSADIKKFEGLGTRSFPAEMAIGRAASFHTSIGTKRKMERLKFLQQYWTSKVKNHPEIKFYTPLDKGSCAIATVGVNGKTGAEVESYLFENYGLHTVPIKWQEIDGIRVTPHVYTRTADLDKLVEGLLSLADKAGGK